MSSLDISQGNTSMSSLNEDSVSSVTKTGQSKKHHQQQFSTAPQRVLVVDDRDKHSFYRDLYNFHDIKG